MAQRVVQDFDVSRGQAVKLRKRPVAIHGVTPHGEVRRIDLQNESGVHDGFVFGLHGRCDGFQILILRAVVVVGLKKSDNPGGGSVHEGRGGRCRSTRRIEIADIRLKGKRSAHLDVPDTARAGGTWRVAPRSASLRSRPG